MDAVTRVRELGRRYLDGESSPADRAELERLLADSPAAADAFARLARFEADLSGLFTEEQAIHRQTAFVRVIECSGRWRRLWRRGLEVCVAAGVLAVLCAAVLWWLSGQMPGPSSPPLPLAERRHELLSGTLLVSGRVADRLSDGDEVQVAGATPAVLRLSDGSTAHLEPASRAVLHGPGEESSQLVELIEGEGRFEVHPTAQGFEVETPLGRIIALGTDFTVQLSSESGESNMSFEKAVLAVAVWTGVVQVEVGPITHLLAAGESRTFGQDRKKEGDKKPGNKGMRTVVAGVTGTQLTVTAGGKKNKETSIDVPATAKVTIDGKAAKLAELVRGMVVLVEKDDKGAVVSVRAEGRAITGVLKAVEKDKVTVTARRKDGQPGEESVHVVTGDVQVLINGKPGRLADLKAKDAVTVRLSADGKRVVSILHGRKAAGEGRKGALQAAGQIKAIDTAGRTITLVVAKTGDEKSLKVATDVQVVVDGKPGKFEGLKAGTRAVVILDKESKAVTGINVGGRKGEPKK